VIPSKSNSCVNFDAPFAGRILCGLKYFQQQKRSRNPASKFSAWMWTSTYQEQLTPPSWPYQFHLYLFTCEERSNELRERLVLRLYMRFLQIWIFFFFLLKLSAVCTFWIVLMCWCQKWFLKNKKTSLACISAWKAIWKAPATTLPNTLYVGGVSSLQTCQLVDKF